jgi:hypothetical protein
MPALAAIFKMTIFIVRWLAGRVLGVATPGGRAAMVDGLKPALIGAGCLSALVVVLAVWKPFAWRQPGAGIMSVAECGLTVADASNAALKAQHKKQFDVLRLAREEREQIAAERDREAETARKLEEMIESLKVLGTQCASADLVRAFNAGSKK